jgi:riboflavin synthase
MFTGLIEEVGTLTGTQNRPHGRELVFRAGFSLELESGESVAVNGTCLTVTRKDRDSFSAFASEETLSRSNLDGLRPGVRVNLERALRVGSRLGGHIVQGHVDGRCTLTTRAHRGPGTVFGFSASPELLRYLVPKGSVALDGISLTVNEVTAQGFSIFAIPHTLSHTTLPERREGDTLNLETDVLAKYVERLVRGQQPERAPERSFEELLWKSGMGTS